MCVTSQMSLLGPAKNNTLFIGYNTDIRSDAIFVTSQMSLLGPAKNNTLFIGYNILHIVDKKHATHFTAAICEHV